MKRRKGEVGGFAKFKFSIIYEEVTVLENILTSVPHRIRQTLPRAARVLEHDTQLKMYSLGKFFCLKKFRESPQTRR